MTVTIPVVSANGAQSTVTLSAPTIASTGDLLVPSNWRAKGANVAFNFSDGTASLGAEGGSWVNFASNYTTWWQPQINDAAAIGINCLRIWGSPQPVCDGYISLSTYLANWETVLNYCNTKGIKVYPCGGDMGRWTTASNSAVVSLYNSWASMLSNHSNVIGVDLTNEVWVKCLPTSAGGEGLSESATLTLLGQMKNVVNAHGLPATNSQGITYGGGGWTLNTYMGVDKASFYSMSDFIDLHLYHPWTASDMATLYNDPTLGPTVAGKQMFFGEFGCLPTDSDRSTLYPAINTLIQSSHNVVGGTCWSLWDYTNDPSWRWGLYSMTGWNQGPFNRSLRTDISNQFASFVKTR